MIKYITKPPTIPMVFSNIPSFIMKRYKLKAKEYIEKLVAWSIREYYDMIVYLYSSNQIETAKVLESQYSSVDFLSRCRSFRVILETMNSEIWDTLTRETKEQLIQAKNILVQSENCS